MELTLRLHCCCATSAGNIRFIGTGREDYGIRQNTKGPDCRASDRTPRQQTIVLQAESIRAHKKRQDQGQTQQRTDDACRPFATRGHQTQRKHSLLQSSSALCFSSLSSLSLLLHFLLVWTTGRSIFRCLDRIIFLCSSVKVHASASCNIDGVMTASNRRSLRRNKQHLDVNSCLCLAKR